MEYLEKSNNLIIVIDEEKIPLQLNRPDLQQDHRKKNVPKPRNDTIIKIQEAHKTSNKTRPVKKICMAYCS